MISAFLSRIKLEKKLNFSLSALIFIMVLNAVVAGLTAISITRQVEYLGKVEQMIRTVTRTAMIVRNFSQTHSREDANLAHTSIESADHQFQELRTSFKTELDKAGIHSLLGSFKGNFHKFVTIMDQTAILESRTIYLGRNLIATMDETRSRNIDLFRSGELNSIISQILDIQWLGQEAQARKASLTPEKVRSIISTLITYGDQTRFQHDGTESQRAFFLIVRDAKDYVSVFERYIYYKSLAKKTEQELFGISEQIHKSCLALEAQIHSSIHQRIVTVVVIMFIILAISIIVARFIIAGQRQAARDLTSSLSLLNATLESTADGIVVADCQGRIDRWNQKFIELWHIPDEILKNQSAHLLSSYVASQLLNPEQYTEDIMELFNNPEISRNDTIYLADGRIFKRSSQPQRIGVRIVGRVCSFNDITEQKMAERALEASNQKLESMCVTDSLTQIANRRRFDEVLTKEIARHTRTGAPLSLIMLDIDHFKAFNDTYGHVNGDECLRQVAQIIAECTTRAADLAARYGGEEFACILPETGLSGAIAIAETIRQRIEAQAIPHNGSNVVPYVTASLGIVTVHCTEEFSADAITAQADKLLYRAKTSGRNRIEYNSESTPILPPSSFIKEKLVQLVWSDAYCCGNPLIDSQHKALIETANKLLQATLSGKPASDISALISRLLDDVRQHFRDEEQILKSLGFIGIEHHSVEHARLLTKGIELSEQFKASTLTIGHAFQFIASDVVMMHMLGADMEYFSFIAAIENEGTSHARKQPLETACHENIYGIRPV